MTGGRVVVVGGADRTAGGVVAMVGGADITVGGEIFTIGASGTAVDGAGEVVAAAAGLERRGGDGAIGSTDCVPPTPGDTGSAARLMIFGARSEGDVFWAAASRALLAARSASLEE
jgi:hypothetical protein